MTSVDNMENANMSILDEIKSRLITEQVIQKFWSKVEKPSDLSKCWIWKGSQSGGAGMFFIGEDRLTGKIINVQAHRFAYDLENPGIPGSIQIRRNCNNKLCVNPSHCRLHTDLESLFWTKVAKSKAEDGCWFWTGQVMISGYGDFKTNKKSFLAHRYAYEITYGKIPSRKVLVCHKCDNKLCVRPDHLFLGSHKNNSQDMVAKGRSTKGRKGHSGKSGESNSQSKLTAKDIEIIRWRLEQGETQQSLANEYGVTQTNISAIKRGKSWSDTTQ
ncbi:HNH endonuclease (plasmid) [Kovacikia minuta CCNUW1]|uniref:HNH endonuclease n=1 Tax=Kovacikia minuta TaxID=2931930 RepID=UPI001CCE39E0|nr:HNH endonuclease [Kovacikia minuta]UBF29847.1 HNH endonuclease [Kovacikia minuta CCNUW1]